MGRLEVDLYRFTGVRRLQMPGRPDLERATRRPVEDEGELRPVLGAWAEALRLWLDDVGHSQQG